MVCHIIKHKDNNTIANGRMPRIGEEHNANPEKVCSITYCRLFRAIPGNIFPITKTCSGKVFVSDDGCDYQLKMCITK